MTRNEELQALKQLRQIYAYKVSGPITVFKLGFAICAFIVGMPLLACVLAVIARFLHCCF